MIKKFRVVHRLYRLGLFKSYVSRRFRYGRDNANFYSLVMGVEEGLHLFLDSVSRYVETMLIDVGCIPFEKLRYADVYVGFDIALPRLLIKPPKIYMIPFDINERKSHMLIRSIYNMNKDDVEVVVSTIDVEGNVAYRTLYFLYSFSDYVIHEIHDKYEYNMMRYVAEDFNLFYILIDKLPYGSKHYLIINPNRHVTSNILLEEVSRSKNV